MREINWIDWIKGLQEAAERVDAVQDPVTKSGAISYLLGYIASCKDFL